MPQYASFDPNVSDPSPVIGWYDTDILNYPNLNYDNMISMTESEWNGRMTGSWAVSAGALVAYTPPPRPQLESKPRATLADLEARIIALEKLQKTNMTISDTARPYTKTDAVSSTFLPQT